MPLSNLPGPWRWEKRNGFWWRVHLEQGIEDGPHRWHDLNLGFGGFGAEGHSRWYDRDGEPIPVAVASDLLGDPDYKIVAQDIFVIGDEPVKVSTVWLGLDHNWWPDRPMKIFETMIFGGELDMWQARYTTEDEARQGHADAVDLVTERKTNGEDRGHRV